MKQKLKSAIEAEPAASDQAEEVQPVPPPVGKLSCPIVGIGASAGGLAAFEAFFSGMPKDSAPGMAFVLVQHLAPDHESILAEIIRRYTRMEVFEVEDGMVVEPNCTYIIPPGRDMAFLNGTLQLLEPVAPRGQRMAIDFFFRSLAQDQHERAIGIILSGTGSDGTQGVRAIKGEGGMVMVQTPATTEHDGMPRSAMATGLVDYELPPAEMPAQLIAYVSHAIGKAPGPAPMVAPDPASAFQKVFILLRAHTGHDFSQYKPSTIHRRIERRLAVHQIGTLEDYVKFLQQTPAEVEMLYRDLLIGVTSFFRDPKAFEALEQMVIPKLFAGVPADAVIRVWVVGCSTGEEAYSIAILLAERQEAMQRLFKVQVFASDIDNRAIATARAGVYPASIAADVSPQRLARFFQAEPDGSGYRIHKGIRDMLIFSEHNIITNPPFAKLDLISCRNLLIYLNSEVQKKIIPLFHFALRPGGRLLLGTSETVGEFGELFATLDRKAKLFVRRTDLGQRQRVEVVRFQAPVSALQVCFPQVAERSVVPFKPSLRQLTEQTLLQEVALAAALVNARGDIFYLHGRTGRYLEPAPGESGVNNILEMARVGLLHELTTALRQAARTTETVRRLGLRVKTNWDFTSVNLTVRPVVSATAASPLFLIVLEDAPAAAEALRGEPLPAISASLPEAEWRIVELQQKLRASEEYLQAAHEELETSNEELKSSNEEMQSVNEELQSTNEELETSKEELQSINEELATVNSELQIRVADLARSNCDMSNLLAGTGIGTVFIDHQLRILRFTPTVTQVLNLIPSDVGRPLGHVVTNLCGYDRLVADTQAVLDTLIPKEVVVQTALGGWYAMRIQPYRTQENVIEGVVITFVDITEMERTRETLRHANDLLRLAVVVRDAHDAITVQDLEGRILAWNPGAVRLYGWSEAAALKMNIRELIAEPLQAEALDVVRRLSEAAVLEPYRMPRIARDGQIVEVWLTATALVNETGQVYAIATTERECRGEGHKR